MCLLVSHMHWARPKQRQVPSLVAHLLSPHTICTFGYFLSYRYWSAEGMISILRPNNTLRSFVHILTHILASGRRIGTLSDRTTTSTVRAFIQVRIRIKQLHIRAYIFVILYSFHKASPFPIIMPVFLATVVVVVSLFSHCWCSFPLPAWLTFTDQSAKTQAARWWWGRSVALISREMFLTHSSYSRAHTYKRTTTPRAWPVHQRSHLKRRNGNLLQRTKEKELRLFCICICIIPRISAAPIRTWAYFLCVIWLIASRLKIITLFSGNVCSGQQKIRRSDAASHRHRIPVYSTAFPSHSWVTR